MGRCWQMDGACVRDYSKYFDNAATTPLCEGAKSAIVDAFDCFGNPSSLHTLGTSGAAIVKSTAEKIATALKVSADEIIFTSGGTESDNLAIRGAVAALSRRGNKIVTTAFEHSAVANTFKSLQDDGFEVVFLKPDSTGTVPISAFIDAIDEKTILVSCMSINNETGARLPIESLKKAITFKNSPALLHIDATQSFLKYDIFPRKLGIDLLTVSAHKIYAPKGVGALYIKKGVRIKPITFGGEQFSSLRPGTEPTLLIAGFGGAIDEFGDNKQNAVYVRELKQRVIDNLSSCEAIKINSPKDSSDYILNLSVKGIRSETMLHFLEQESFFVSSGSACAKGKKSHVLQSLGLDNATSDSAIRISFSKYNTFESVDALCERILLAERTLIKSKI